MSCRKIPCKINWIGIINITCTIFLIITAFLQYNLSKELSNLTFQYEKEKLLTNKKELRTTCINIINLFSIEGISERKKYTKSQNLELAKSFDSLLTKELDNYLLISNAEYLKRWMNAIDFVSYYRRPEFFDKPYSLISTNEVKKGLICTDSSFNIDFVGTINSAYQEVLFVYSKLGLSMTKSKESLDSLTSK